MVCQRGAVEAHLLTPNRDSEVGPITRDDLLERRVAELQDMVGAVALQVKPLETRLVDLAVEALLSVGGLGAGTSASAHRPAWFLPGRPHRRRAGCGRSQLARAWSFPRPLPAMAQSSSPRDRAGRVAPMTRLYTCETCGRIGPTRHCPEHPTRDNIGSSASGSRWAAARRTPLPTLRIKRGTRRRALADPAALVRR